MTFETSGSDPDRAAVILTAEQLIADCEVTFTRRGGPGGQHRNKVSTAVVLKHRPTGLTAEASERRSQADNRDVAIKRLRVELALRLRQDVHSTSADLVGKYGGSPFRVSPSNQDFAIVLTDLMNRISAEQGKIEQAAAFWNTTVSQIVRFLKQEPRALVIVNEWRAANEHHPLR